MMWWVVQTESQREHIVRVLLMRARYETYIPRIKHRSRISPLFPGYLFVRTTDRWYPVRWTDHVVRVLMSGDQPAQLPEEIVDRNPQTGIRRIREIARTPAIAQRPACARHPRKFRGIARHPPRHGKPRTGLGFAQHHGSANTSGATFKGLGATTRCVLDVTSPLGHNRLIRHRISP